MRRRDFVGCAALPLWGCTRPVDIAGGFTGIAHERGHLLREQRAWPAPTRIHRTGVVIAGGGVAGLAAARALRLRGADDFALLELEDVAGGNGRGGSVQGISCPLGAHYLPVPGEAAQVVQGLLEELGLRRRVAGRWIYDERHLCHSPQERLFFQGQWQDGLLPMQGVGAATLAQYRRFSQLVEQAQRLDQWTIPVSLASSSAAKQALWGITFKTYLDQHGLLDAHLRWYLDYCCRDDYGAGMATVSAWAGIHYFASRHGFYQAERDAPEHEAVLTWPEGNGWLARRLSAPLGDRLHTGQIVVRIAETRSGVEVDALDNATQTVQRWLTERCVVALPMLVAARVVENAPQFLRDAAAGTRYAPWLVANLHVRAPLHDRPGAAPSWDNVLYGDAGAVPGLGYVDATHQSLASVPGATVLTYYRALGDEPDGRLLLLQTPWTRWRDTILAELGTAHPDLAAKTTRIDITRYGHAMAIPTPRATGSSSAWPAPAPAHGRLAFAHSDWAGYSVFEEAFSLGHAAGAGASA